MPFRSPAAAGAFYESPYAAELRRGPSLTCRSPALEAEYLEARLLENRTLIRLAGALAVMLCGLRAVEQALLGPWNRLFLAMMTIALVASIALVGVSWSSRFVRWYLPFARIAVPARNFVGAIALAAVAGVGQTEILVLLPLIVLGPFFFLGLPYRMALTAVIPAAAAFVVSAIVFEIPTPVILRLATFLVIAVISCAVAARHLETRSRTTFLQGRLLAELAEHDALTGTKNRRVLDGHLSRLWQQGIEDRRAIAVLLIDVDHFKAFNDLYGHQAGDQALYQIAKTLQDIAIRPLDIVARYGGEEFAVVMYDVNARQAQDFAERMRLAVLNLGIPHRGSRNAGKVTISVGVAAGLPGAGSRPRGALQLADEALYVAKSQGRNRVHVLDEVDYRTLVTGVFAVPRAEAGSR
jgi:diguanylate cyclase (GGDEF)-like protein